MAIINTNSPSRRPIETQIQNGSIQKNLGAGSSVSVPNNVGYPGQASNLNFSTNFTVTASFNKVPGTINVDLANNISINGMYRGMAVVPTYPTNGKSIELFYTIQPGWDSAVVQSYDRTASVWKPLVIDASVLTFSSSGISCAQANSQTFIVSPLLKYARGAYNTYPSVGATSSINLSTGGMQYCFVSANSTLSLSNGVAGERASVVMKNTGGAAVTINLPAGVTSSSGASSVTLQPNVAVLFDIAYTGSVYFVNPMSFISGYIYP